MSYRCRCNNGTMAVQEACYNVLAPHKKGATLAGYTAPGSGHTGSTFYEGLNAGKNTFLSSFSSPQA